MAASPNPESAKRRASPRRAPKSTTAEAKGSRRPARPTKRGGPPPPPDSPASAAPAPSQKLQKVLAPPGLGARPAMEEVITADRAKSPGEPTIAEIGARAH